MGAARAAAAAQSEDDLVGRLKVISLNNEKLEPIARANDLSTLAVVAANWGLSQFWAETRDEVILPSAHLLPAGLRNGVLVNLAEFRLYYFKGGALVQTAPVGIGVAGLETPLGSTSVVRKMANPTWTPTPEARADHPDWPKVIPPGPDNPMGLFALYLGWRYIAIHGNQDQFGIGRPYTRGCIRLLPEDIEPLFKVVPIGTQVEVVKQPVKLGWHESELFLEAEPDSAQFDELNTEGKFTEKPAEDLTGWITAAAGDRAHDVDWPTVTAALERRNGIPTQITNVTTHPIDIFAPTMALRESLGAFMEASKGFAAKAKPPQEPSAEELLREHRLRFPYNI